MFRATINLVPVDNFFIIGKKTAPEETLGSV